MFRKGRSKGIVSILEVTQIFLLRTIKENIYIILHAITRCQITA